MNRADERRARIEVRKTHLGAPGEDDHDALYWLRIPAEDRANFVWELSRDTWLLAHPGVDPEQRLPRPLAVLVRRGRARAYQTAEEELMRTQQEMEKPTGST